jgi:molecular chaperone Hsp33
VVLELMTVGAGASGAAATDDVCLPFLVNGGAFRGRLVRLTSSVTEILQRHKDPEPVSRLLGEAMATAVALAGGLKYKGIFTLQVQGKGPVHTLVTDVTSEGDLRGCAKFDADAVAAEIARPRPQGLQPQFFGIGGHLAFTVDQGPHTERYQGIVELAGEGLADAIHHYFRQSEQLESALKVAVSAPQTAGGQWVASALLLQRMPEAGGVRLATADDMDDAWRTAVILLGSVRDGEMLDLSITPERLLTRLFFTIGVMPSARRAITARCRCSRERSERILASFPLKEIRSYAENGKVHVTCEYCRADYAFNVEALEAAVSAHREDNERDASS